MANTSLNPKTVSITPEYDPYTLAPPQNPIEGNETDPPPAVNLSNPPATAGLNRQNKPQCPPPASPLPMDLELVTATIKAFADLSKDLRIAPEISDKLVHINPRNFKATTPAAVTSMIGKNAKFLALIFPQLQTVADAPLQILNMGIGTGFMAAALAMFSKATDFISVVDFDQNKLAAAYTNLQVHGLTPLLTKQPRSRLHLQKINNTDYSDLPIGVTYDIVVMKSLVKGDAVTPEIIRRIKPASGVIVYESEANGLRQIKLAQRAGTAETISILKVW